MEELDEGEERGRRGGGEGEERWRRWRRGGEMEELDEGEERGRRGGGEMMGLEEGEESSGCTQTLFRVQPAATLSSIGQVDFSPRHCSEFSLQQHSPV
ncbi:unnamed protein product [Arctogadus glacialis]